MRQLGKDHGQYCHLPKCACDLPRRVREHIDAVLFRLRQRTRQRSRQVNSVGIRKEQPFATRDIGSGDDGVVLTRPTRRQRTGGDHTDSRKTLGDFTRAVR